MRTVLSIAVVVAALSFGGYWLGHAVWQMGNDNRSRALGETQSTESTTVRTPTSAARDTLSSPWVRAALLATGAIVAVAAIHSAVGSSRRHRRRQRWHA